MSQIATQHDVWYSQTADYIRNTDSQMRADALQRHLSSSFTRVCACNYIGEPQGSIEPGPVNIARVELDGTSR